MTPAEQLQADLAARVADRRRVIDEMIRGQTASELSAPEKRGIGATVRALAKPLLKLAGVDLP